MKQKVKFALDVISNYNVDYADVRLRQTNIEMIRTYNNVLKNVRNDDELGIGIRVLINGRWGFAATPHLDEDNISKTVKRAVNIAKAAAKIEQKPIILTKEKAVIDTFKTPIKKNPFDVSLSDKANILFNVYENAKKVKKVKKVDGYMYFHRIHQQFGNTEGSQLENDIYMSGSSYEITAVGDGSFETRNYQMFPKSKGYEWIEEQPLEEKAEELAEDAVKKLTAKQGPAGKKDLILMPSHLSLTIHESVGHPTELDRVLGWEANFAGISFATTEKRGNFQYGSDKVNLVADNTLEEGLGTWGFDDDGIPGQKWHMVKDGILINYGTTRDTAHYIGEEHSLGCNRADSYASQPINRIPNLSLMPGKEKLSLDDLIADTKDGILIDGRGSFSIDQRRYNFQFGGDMFYEIKNGKITQPLRDVTYQSITPEFWNSCDAICDEDHWQKYGVLNCGRGEPGQRMQMTHAASPARFRNIDVGGALNG